MNTDKAVKVRVRKSRVKVNLDRSTWSDQFRKMIESGKKPEKSVWPDSVSAKADRDWKWVT